MTRATPFAAVVSDMDGVFTRTATLHERAWTTMFDAYLRRRGVDAGKDLGAFSSADYRAYVDGKPRYDGVRDFLASRGLDLPEGEPSDAPTRDTICGLGNRKNELLLGLLAREGAEVFEDAVVALARWRRGGLRVALVSSSRNCRRVLEAAGLAGRFDVVVDGELASELGLHGKLEIMREASRRLGVSPADAVVLEDATAGVRAARQAGFGLALGVARNTHDRTLREAGADEVVHRVDRARFLRRLPAALERLEELSRWQGDRELSLFLDFDGTLAPIVDDPKAAQMPDETRRVLVGLAERCSVAIVSGRDREDVQGRVGIRDLVYAGNHGFDIAGRGHERTLPEASGAQGEIDRAVEELTQHLGRLTGVILERKRFSVAVHYRMVRSDTVVEQVARTVAAVSAKTSLRTRVGKKVFELEPAVDWDKGHALAWLLDVMKLDPARHFPVYVGDDETDEDAFAALGGRGAAIRVGAAVSTSLADYRLADPAEVRALLVWLSGPRPTRA
jgi:trehalose-phosphatase